MFLRINSALRLTAMYDINKNETTKQIAKYSQDIKDNIFTLRLQYKF
jgi:phosphate-selective porin